MIYTRSLTQKIFPTSTRVVVVDLRPAVFLQLEEKSWFEVLSVDSCCGKALSLETAFHHAVGPQRLPPQSAPASAIGTASISI